MWGAGRGGGSDSGVGGGGFFCAKVRSVHEITRFFHPLLGTQAKRGFGSKFVNTDILACTLESVLYTVG